MHDRRCLNESCNMNLLDFVAVIIGLVSVYYVVPLPVFLRRKWGYSGHSGWGVTDMVSEPDCL